MILKRISSRLLVPEPEKTLFSKSIPIRRTDDCIDKIGHENI